MNESGKKYAAEFIGTMVLVLMGCGSVVFAASQIGFVGISFTFGLAVMAMIYAIGPISGCHINPAITIAMLVAGKIKSGDAIFYIIAQVIGAIVGVGIVYAIGMGHEGFNPKSLAQNGYADFSPGGYSLTSGLICEVVMTFIFVLVIFGSTAKNGAGNLAGVAIGLTLVLIHLVSINVTGTSVNPARSIGPAVFVMEGTIKQLWLFILAPTAGGVLAAIVWKMLGSDQAVSKSGGK